MGNDVVDTIRVVDEILFARIFLDNFGFRGGLGLRTYSLPSRSFRMRVSPSELRVPVDLV